MATQQDLNDGWLARWRERRRAKRQQALERAFFAQERRRATGPPLSDAVDSWTGFGDGGAGCGGGGCGGGS